MTAEQYIVVVTCVVLSKDSRGRLRTLILKRNKNETEGPGLWTVPGGKIERIDWGSSVATDNVPVFMGVLERAAIREIREETGINVAHTDLMTHRSRAIVFERQNNIPTLVHRFWTCIENMPHVLLNMREAVRKKWVLHSELSQYRFIGNVKEDIENAMEECRVHHAHLDIVL